MTPTQSCTSQRSPSITQIKYINMSYRVIVKFDSVPHEHIDAPTGKVPQPLRLIDVYD